MHLFYFSPSSIVFEPQTPHPHLTDRHSEPLLVPTGLSHHTLVSRPLGDQVCLSLVVRPIVEQLLSEMREWRVNMHIAVLALQSRQVSSLRST